MQQNTARNPQHPSRPNGHDKIHDPRATDTTQLITGQPTTGKALFTPTNPQEAWQLSEMLSQSNFIPEGYRGQPANILVAICLGSEVGLNPLQSVQSICVINGHPAVYGDALLALVMASPLCEHYEDGFDVESQCGWARTTRHGHQPKEQIFSMDMAKKAGLLNKKGPWSQYPERMCKMRARSWLCRDVYPDVLKGLSTVRVMDSTTMPVQGQSQNQPPQRQPSAKQQHHQPSQRTEHAIAGEVIHEPEQPDEPLDNEQEQEPAEKTEKPAPITPDQQMAVNLIIDALAEAETPEELKDIKADIKALPEQVALDAQLIDLWNTRRAQLKKASA